jgi:hypothetical protein
MRREVLRELFREEREGRAASPGESGSGGRDGDVTATEDHRDVPVRGDDGDGRGVAGLEPSWLQDAPALPLGLDRSLREGTAVVGHVPRCGVFVAVVGRFPRCGVFVAVVRLDRDSVAVHVAWVDPVAAGSVLDVDADAPAVGVAVRWVRVVAVLLRDDRLADVVPGRDAGFSRDRDLRGSATGSTAP